VFASHRSRHVPAYRFRSHVLQLPS
jgi:hypothetical protein